MFKVNADAKVRIYYELANISKSNEKTYALGVARLIFQAEKCFSPLTNEKMKSTVQMLKAELKNPSLIFFFNMREIYRAELCKRRMCNLKFNLAEDILRNPLNMKCVNELIALLKGEKSSSFREEALNICLLSLISHQDDRGVMNLLTSYTDFRPDAYFTRVVIELVCDKNLIFDLATLIKVIAVSKDWKALAEHLLAKADPRDVKDVIPSLSEGPLKTYLLDSIKA